MSDDGRSTLLRLARETAGVSLSGLASRTHYSRSLLGMLENGRRQVHLEHITAYSRALNVPIDLLLTPSDDPLRVAHEWLVSESPALVHAAAGRRVGVALAHDLEQRVIELRHLDDTVGGEDLYPIVAGELDNIRMVIDRCAYTETIGVRLHTIAGELAQLVGWVASDAGRYNHAQRVYLRGVADASAAEDRPLGAQLLSCLSYQIANVGNPADASVLARSAANGAADATPVVLALLLERVAWASARSRDAESARRALDAVDDVYERRSVDIAEPEWVYWLDRNEIDVMAGRCLVELDRPAEAEVLLSQAIQNYPPEHAREVALYRTWLAESYLRRGDLDGARAAIVKAAKSADRVHSARLNQRIGDVQRLLSA
jgi:transcriptional regulator with XRE-family HTH domain